MTIKVGDRIPDVTVYVMSDQGPQAVKTGEFFKGKKVALFALPGAFTPTCSAKHLPGFLDKHGELAAKGVDKVACLSVNDAFVMGAWGKQQNAGDKVEMLADGSGEFTKAIGMEFDLSARGLGVRSQRYSMLVDDGVVKTLNLEKPGAFEVSDASTLLGQL
jgi:peroxiredoxin